MSSLKANLATSIRLAGSIGSLSYVSWKPDRRLNPQYDGIPDVERYGAIVHCPCAKTTDGFVLFDSDVARKLEPGRPMWKVHSFEPLTLSPSIHRTDCGCHGFIREGRWIPA